MHQELKSKHAFIEKTETRIKEIYMCYITALAVSQVYERATGLFGSARGAEPDMEQKSSYEDEDNELISETSIDLGFFSPIVGVIASEDDMRMKRLVFRASRGKAYVQFY
jgi:hypothetical protein